MPIPEDKALEILAALIAKPESKAEDIPRIWSEIVATYHTLFAPPEPEKKKRRRRAGGKVVGWPAGVSRNDYKTWKDAQTAKGVTENLNPQELKRQMDAGIWSPGAVQEAAPAPKAKKAKK